MRALSSLLAGVALASVVAGSAAAAAPTRLTIPGIAFDDPFVCGGDPVIHVSYTASFRVVTWTDASGTITRDATFAPGSRVVLSDPVTGRSLSGISPAVFRTTFAPDGSIERLTVTGLNAAITIPGTGAVLLDTGRISWSGGFLGPVEAESGPHGWFGSADHEAFCDWFRA